MSTKYPQCDHIKRPSYHVELTEELAEAIGKDYRALPIFEKGLHDHTFRDHHSLRTNEFLKCRWNNYKEDIASRVKAPVYFPDIRDYHFYNCRNRFIPAQSAHYRHDFRMKLKPGPGVDFIGQMPIPDDLCMKRGIQEQELPKQLLDGRYGSMKVNEGEPKED